MSGSPFLYPRRVGFADVSRFEKKTAEFRALDYRDGGGACQPAVDRLRSWGEDALAAVQTDRVRARMLVAQADLCNLAGWIAFDTGMAAPARVHFGRALDLAWLAGRSDLVANIFYRMGRVELHHDAAAPALQLFQWGLAAARQSGSAHCVAILSANNAWAYAMLGSVAAAEVMLGRAADELAASDHSRVPRWAAFFTSSELSAMTGSVYTDLALRVDRRHTASAIPALFRAVGAYGEDMARSQAFSLISLSLNHLLDGDADEAAGVGTLAIEIADGLTSTRTKDRMRPLARSAIRRLPNSFARELAARLHAFGVRTDGPS